MEPGDSQTFPRVPQLSQQLWFSKMLSPKLRLTLNHIGNAMYAVVCMCIFTIYTGMNKKDLIHLPLYHSFPLKRVKKSSLMHDSTHF